MIRGEGRGERGEQVGLHGGWADERIRVSRWRVGAIDTDFGPSGGRRAGSPLLRHLLGGLPLEKRRGLGP